MAAVLPVLTIAGYALKLIEAAPALLAATQSAGVALDVLLKGNAQIQLMKQENRVPTQVEWDTLDAEIAALQGKLHSK